MPRHARFRSVVSAGLGLAAALSPAVRATDVAAIPLCPPQPATPPNNVRVVTGAPYSAFGTSETVVTLADGNRIVRQNTMRVWRDSDGRTRSEISLSSIGGRTPLEVNATVTVIDDPAARERYMMQPGRGMVTIPISPCRAPIEGEPDFVGPVRAPGTPMNFSARKRLGERQLNGETVSGSRIEATIPAGAVGNDKPINMSAEQWYGRDLKVVVEATYRDPRTGETRYVLREIQRKEPDAALFRVPEGEAKPRR
jgi:hypothetical protein